MTDPLPRLVNQHTWASTTVSSGATHTLVPMGHEDLLDWTEESGAYEVWVRHGAIGATGDPYPNVRNSGTWASIRKGHELVYLADTPGSTTGGNVLDWEPGTRKVRIWRWDRSIGTGDPMPQLLNQSRFTTIKTGHTLIYLDHDRVLDWEPATGRGRVWAYDRSQSASDPLPTKVTDVTWVTIRLPHQLVYVGGDLVLDWDEGSGDVRVWRYDRSLTGDVDPLPTLEMQHNWTGKIQPGRRLIYLGGDQILDWDPATGHERIWDFDRPMMPASQFSAMLSVDSGVAAQWVAAAEVALKAYQTGLASGVHDASWQATDAALSIHFHVHAHPAGVQTAVTEVQGHYASIFHRLIHDMSSITQVSKAQAMSEIHNKYVRGQTLAGTYTHLTPAYRPFDTIGQHSLDGAGPKLRAAILIHETAHFVGLNKDHAEEWNPNYATLPSEKAVKNPSSYAAFAHHVHTGVDLRFGLKPWE